MTRIRNTRVIFICGILLAACAGKTPTPTLVVDTPTPAYTPTTPAFTPTPTLAPLGSAERPVVLGLFDQGNPDSVYQAGQQIADQLGNQLGLKVTLQAFSSYDLLVEKMRTNEVHIAWLPPITYVLAHTRGAADAALVVNRFGVYQYGAQFMANRDSGFGIYFDPASDQNTVEAEVALMQFQGRRPCWVDETSTSGAIIPEGYLKRAGVTTLAPVYTRTASATLRALYIKGICDFGAVYAFYGDPRTSSTIQQDISDMTDKVVILWRTEAVIPNLNISYSPQLPEDLRRQISDVFLSLATNTDDLALMSQMAADNVEGLKEIDDSFYDSFRGYLQASGVLPSELMGK